MINKLSNFLGAKKNRKRKGRGIGSGMGKTCGRGVKGQKSRSGVSIKTEGGQMSLLKSIPKRGFVSRKSPNYVAVNLSDIDDLVSNEILSSNEVIDKDALLKVGFFTKAVSKIKIIGSSRPIKNPLSLNFDYYSGSIRNMVEPLGGKII